MHFACSTFVGGASLVLMATVFVGGCSSSETSKDPQKSNENVGAAAGMPGSGGGAGSGLGTGGTSGAGGMPPGSGGTASAGRPGAGGAGQAGGTGGQSGSAGSPVSAGAAGMPGGGSAGSAGAPGPSGSCSFTIDATLSEKIGSVGIVTWSVDRPTLESASIEFGLETTYGMTAPVDLKEPSYRTLLLGMKFDHDYHYRVVAKAGGETCMSEDKVIHTGPVPTALSKPKIETAQAGKEYGGFLIAERWGMNNNGPAFILDADGDYVWWYPGDVDIIRTRLDITGKKMWIRNTAQTNGSGVVKRVTLDGLKEEKWMLPNTTHDLAVIPDGHVALVGHAADGCDEILDFDPETAELVSLFNAKESHGKTMCHVNYVAYYAKDDSFIFSDYEASTLIKITRKGDFVWALNGTGSTISGTDWEHEHGVMSLAVDELLVFSNGGAGENSIVYDLKLDVAAKTATELWRYDGGLAVSFGGDIQKLDNGSYVFTYSSAGVVQEVDADRKLIQTITWPLGSTVAYSEKVKTLYGAPPPRIY